MPPVRLTASGAGRLAGLDGLRGLAGVGVVLVHVWLYTGNNDPSQPAWLKAVIGELRLGLMAFFVLSAFLLVRPWLAAARGDRPPPRPATFLWRRAARILPGYWLAITGAFLLLRDAGSGRSVSAADLPAFLVMAQNQVEGLRDKLVPPAWSLCVEITFYALLPLLGAAILALAGGRDPATRGFGRPRLAVGAVAGAMAAVGVGWSVVAYRAGWGLSVTTSLPTYLPIFACGVAAATLTPRTAWQRRGLLVAGALLVALDAVWHHDGTGALGHVLKDLPAGAGFGLVVAGLAAGPPGLLERAPLRWLGTVSYGTYLWHMPILFLLRESHRLPQNPAAAFAAVLLPALAVAALSWYGVERPLLAWATARPGRPRPWRIRTSPSTTTRRSARSTARSGSSGAPGSPTASSRAA